MLRFRRDVTPDPALPRTITERAPVLVEASGRVRFEPIEDHLLRARVQTTFDALERAGLVEFSSHRSLPPGAFFAMELRGSGPFRYTALVRAARAEPSRDPSPGGAAGWPAGQGPREGAAGEAETFWVLRSGPGLKGRGELAGPYSVQPFSPVPAMVARLPIPRPAEDLRPRAPSIAGSPEAPPLQLPTGVPALPHTLGVEQGRQTPLAAVLGFVRGFSLPTSGAELLAA